MSVDEEPVVRVTLSKIYDKLLDVEKKVDPIPAAILDLETRMRAVEKDSDPEAMKDVEARMRVVERQMWKWVGALTVIYITSTAFIHFAHI